jgi:hypothetical protein
LAVEIHILHNEGPLWLLEYNLKVQFNLHLLDEFQMVIAEDFNFGKNIWFETLIPVGFNLSC